jgi:hypothetical protein
MSVLLHGKATVLGLLHNAPNSHYHRHSLLLPFDTEERSTWERGTTTVGKVLGATSDHPVVSAVGWDVLLSTLSMGLWAAIRALDVTDILMSSIPFYKRPPVISAQLTDLSENKNSTPEKAPEPSKPKYRIRRKTRSEASEAGDGEALGESTASTTRRRGRPRKAKSDPEEVPGDTTYTPSLPGSVTTVEGDIVPEPAADWESASLAWGLVAVAGLGCGSAGVFGGECISR